MSACLSLAYFSPRKPLRSPCAVPKMERFHSFFFPFLIAEYFSVVSLLPVFFPAASSPRLFVHKAARTREGVCPSENEGVSSNQHLELGGCVRLWLLGQPLLDGLFCPALGMATPAFFFSSLSPFA